MSSLKIRLKRGESEIEISGNEEEITSTFPKLKEWLNQFLETSDVGSAPKSPDAVSVEGAAASYATISTEQIPMIGQSASASEAILKVLDSPWGKRPRTIGEIKAALETNAMPYPVTTISGVLFSLVKGGKARRWKTSTGWVYTTTLPRLRGSSET